MARHPYLIARQEHLGDALDDLQRRGLLQWHWEYDVARSRAIYRVAPMGESEQKLDTRTAERLVEQNYRKLGGRWLPVPHPGGERQRGATLRAMRATNS